MWEMLLASTELWEGLVQGGVARPVIVRTAHF